MLFVSITSFQGGEARALSGTQGPSLALTDAGREDQGHSCLVTETGVSGPQSTGLACAFKEESTQSLLVQ